MVETPHTSLRPTKQGAFPFGLTASVVSGARSESDPNGEIERLQGWLELHCYLSNESNSVD